MNIENKQPKEKQLFFKNLIEGDTFRLLCSKDDKRYEVRFMKIKVTESLHAISLGPKFYVTTFSQNSRIIKVKGTFVNQDC